MMKKIVCLGFVCALLLSVGAVNASAIGVGYSWILEARDAAGNVNTGFYSENGAFASSSGKSTAAGLTGIGCRYGSTYFSVAGLKEATFTADIPVVGTYEVFTTCRNTATNKSPILFKIGHSAGVTELDVDQAVGMASWVSLGTYDFLAGAGTGTVTLSNAHINVSGNMWVDGVKFTLVEEGVVPEPGSLLALGTGLVGLVGLRRRK